MEDLDLFIKVKSDDTQAFEILFERYYKRLCGFAYKFTKKPEIAEEIVSTVFSSIWLKRGELNIAKNVRAYLFRSVYNHSLNYLKSRKQVFSNIEDVEIELPATGENPENSLKLKELEDEIEALISAMPKQRQLVFRMSRIDCLKYSEIAELLSISVFTVQNHMVEAVKYMSNHYKKLTA